MAAVVSAGEGGGWGGERGWGGGAAALWRLGQVGVLRPPILQRRVMAHVVTCAWVA